MVRSRHVRASQDHSQRPSQVHPAGRGRAFRRQGRQRILRHIGVATDAEELAPLKALGEFVKTHIAHDCRPGVFAPEQFAGQLIEAIRGCHAGVTAVIKCSRNGSPIGSARLSGGRSSWAKCSI